jgi:hypothetical protein
VLLRLCPDEYVAVLGRWVRPLAWPILKMTALLRARKAAKKAAKEKTDDAEADTESASLDDDDEEPDEERRIRRIQWVKLQKKHAHGTRPSSAAGSRPASRPTSRRNSRSYQLGSPRNSLDAITPVAALETAVMSLAASEPFDVVQVLEAMRLNPQSAPHGLEIHPQTAKDDPIVYTEGPSAVPPSQNEKVIKYLRAK